MDKISFEERARRFVSFPEDIVFLERGDDENQEEKGDTLEEQKKKDEEKK